MTQGKPDCPDCGEDLALEVFQDDQGYYIGTYCKCGAYDRESQYFCTEEDARQELPAWQDAFKKE